MSAAKAKQEKKKSKRGGPRKGAGRKRDPNAPYSKFKHKDPPADPVIDPPADPVIDPPADPVIDPPADPVIDPSPDPGIDPSADPGIDPSADPGTDPSADPAIEVEEDDDEPDFSKYQTVRTSVIMPDPAAQQQTAAPQFVVIINGKVFLGMINFVAPTVYSFVINFFDKGYIKEDFKLSDEEMKFMEPAADAVAKRIFARMPDWVQLIFCHSMVSMSVAKKKKALRLKS